MKELIERNITDLNIEEFSLEKNLKLKSLIITYLIITRSDNNIEVLKRILINKLNKDTNYRVNNQEYIDIIIKYALSQGYNSNDIIENYITNGYYFHSTNGAFFDSIENNGLLLKNKPWDLNEINLIKNIFSKHNKHDIFGLYQGEEKTPIFLASNLNSSSYYAVSSPSWFLHFTSGGMKDKNYDKEAYRNRDYNACLNNILNLVYQSDLDIKESKIVIDFFDKYYNILGTNNEPLLLLIKRKYIDKKTIKINKNNNESDYDFIKRTLNEYNSGNIMIKDNINRKDIEIIKYFNSKQKKIN